MNKSSTIDYSVLDRPEVLMYLFHPRKEVVGSEIEKPGQEILIDVEQGVAVGANFHMVDKSGASILFFHGNGEIVSDYDDLGPLYNQLLKIPDANHNDIFIRGLSEYLKAVQDLIGRLTA